MTKTALLGWFTVTLVAAAVVAYWNTSAICADGQAKCFPAVGKEPRPAVWSASAAPPSSRAEMGVPASTGNPSVPRLEGRTDGPPPNPRDSVERLLAAYSTERAPEALLQAARLSDQCHLVLATLRDPASDLNPELRSPLPTPGQQEQAAHLTAACAGFVERPVAPAQIDSWYMEAARAGNLGAAARLLAQGKGYDSPGAARSALDQLLAASRPDTFPDLGVALRSWSGHAIIDGHPVPVPVHEAAWHLAGCAATSCAEASFQLAYNCALGGLCGAASMVGYLEQGGLATNDLQDAVRLAGAIKDALARRDYASLGLAAGFP